MVQVEQFPMIYKWMQMVAFRQGRAGRQNRLKLVAFFRHLSDPIQPAVVHLSVYSEVIIVKDWPALQTFTVLCNMYCFLPIV